MFYSNQNYNLKLKDLKSREWGDGCECEVLAAQDLSVDPQHP